MLSHLKTDHIIIFCSGLLAVVFAQSLIFAFDPSSEGMYQDFRRVAEVMYLVEHQYVREVPRRELDLAGVKGLSSLDPQFNLVDKKKRIILRLGSQDIGEFTKTKSDRERLKLIALAVDVLQAKSAVFRTKSPREIGNAIIAGMLTILDRGCLVFEKSEITNDSTNSEAPTPRVSSEMHGDVLYLRLRTFERGTAEELDREIRAKGQPSVKALVLDLRSNPGGLLDSAVDVIGYLVPPGKMGTVEGRDGAQQVLHPHANGGLSNFPLAVLINGRTSSGAELVASVVQERNCGVVIGSKSYGYGLVRTVYPLTSGSFMSVTTGHLVSPAGRKMASEGVEPTLCTSGEGRSAEQILETAARKLDGKTAGDPGGGGNKVECMGMDSESDLDLSVALALLADPVAYSRLVSQEGIADP